MILACENDEGYFEGQHEFEFINQFFLSYYRRVQKIMVPGLWFHLPLENGKNFLDSQRMKFGKLDGHSEASRFFLGNF